MIRSIPKNLGMAALATIALGLSFAPAAAENCEGFTTLTVKLVIVGKPGDGFRIVGKCGDFEVTRCTAVIAAGAKKGKCESTGFIETPGRKKCTVGPKNGNSAKAAEQGSTCLLQ
jgi:hypothetical protein